MILKTIRQHVVSHNLFILYWFQLSYIKAFKHNIYIKFLFRLQNSIRLLLMFVCLFLSSILWMLLSLFNLLLRHCLYFIILLSIVKIFHKVVSVLVIYLLRKILIRKLRKEKCSSLSIYAAFSKVYVYLLKVLNTILCMIFQYGS